MDRLFQPGTDHSVLNLRNSVYLGGHYYSLSTMPETLVALVHTLANGRLITNTSHPGLRLLMRRMVQYLHEAVVHGAKVDPNDFHYVDPENMTMTTAKVLFACISFGVSSNILDGRTYNFDNSAKNYKDLSKEEKHRMDIYDYNSIPEMERVGCIYTRGISFEIADWFANRYELRGDGVQKEDTLAIVLEGMAHEAVGIYAARMRTASSDNAAPNASLELISRQLQGFTGKETFQKQLRSHVTAKLTWCKTQTPDQKYDLLYSWDDFTLHKRPQPAHDWDPWSRSQIFDEGITSLDAVYLRGLDTCWGAFAEGTDSSGK